MSMHPKIGAGDCFGADKLILPSPSWHEMNSSKPTVSEKKNKFYISVCQTLVIVKSQQCNAISQVFAA